MKISYSILTHNETDTLLKLIDFLAIYKDENDVSIRNNKMITE